MRNFLRLIITTLIVLSMCNASMGQNKSEKILNHVLLFKWKDGTPKETLNKSTLLLKGMTEKVEGFLALKYYNITNSSEEFNMIIIGQYSSEEALKNYESHIDHDKFVEMVIPHLEKFAVNDFWTED